METSTERIFHIGWGVQQFRRKALGDISDVSRDLVELLPIRDPRRLLELQGGGDLLVIGQDRRIRCLLVRKSSGRFFQRLLRGREPRRRGFLVDRELSGKLGAVGQLLSRRADVGAFCLQMDTILGDRCDFLFVLEA